MAERKYYELWIRIYKQDLYLLWYYNDMEAMDDFNGLYLDENGSILAFTSQSSLRAFANESGFDLTQDEPVLHNLDAVAGWLRAPVISHINCGEFLASWNLFWDLHSSIHQRNMDREDKKYSRVYNMLFYGKNLPAVTPAGKHWKPPWRRIHVRDLRAALEPQLKFFQSRLRVVAESSKTS